MGTFKLIENKWFIQIPTDLKFKEGDIVKIHLRSGMKRKVKLVKQIKIIKKSDKFSKDMRIFSFKE